MWVGKYDMPYPLGVSPVGTMTGPLVWTLMFAFLKNVSSKLSAFASNAFKKTKKQKGSI